MEGEKKEGKRLRERVRENKREQERARERAFIVKSMYANLNFFLIASFHLKWQEFKCKRRKKN